MKKWVKIFLVILAILIVGIAIFGFITYNQIKGVLNVVNDESFNSAIISLKQGDCSQLSIVEEKSADIKEKINAGCSNPALRQIIIKEEEKMNKSNICEEIKNLDNELDKALAQVKTTCSLKQQTQ